MDGPPDPPKPNGPGGRLHRGPHKYALPTQPGGGAPGGSGGDGASPKRFDDPRPKYDDPSGGSEGTRSGGGGDGVFWFVIPWTKKDIATELARFQQENPGVYDVIWKIIDGDLYMWGRHTDGTVVSDDIPPEILKLLESLLPPDSRLLAQFDMVVGFLDSILDYAGFLGIGGDLAGAGGHFATSLLTAYVHNGTITADDVIAAAKGAAIEVASAVVFAGALAKAIDTFSAAAREGRSVWSSTKGKSAVENAFGHWKKHGSEFPEFQNAKQYVEGANRFVTNPPTGTLTKTRPNGDRLFYHPGSNTFAVCGADGAPRTMFRPEAGMNYWNGQ